VSEANSRASYFYRRGLMAAGLAIAIAGPAAAAEEINGEVIFYERCASCHVPVTESDGRAPPVEALAQRSRRSITVALASGSMWIQGLSLTHAEHAALAEFLVPDDVAGRAPDLSGANMCKSVKPLDARINEPSWNGWGVDSKNARYQTNTTLNASNIPKLKIKWAFGLQDMSTTFGQPTIVGGRMFLGTGNGMVFALDADEGCTVWTYKADASVRTAPNIQKIDGRYMIFFGDSMGNLYGNDAETGKGIWKVRHDDYRLSKIVGALQYHDGKLYVGLNGNEDVAAGDLMYPCCTYRGSVISMDAKTGALIWKTYTVKEEPVFIKKRSNGVDMFGPAGAGIWTSPTLDPKHNLVYVTTSDCHVDPASDACDAIIAYSMDKGKRMWIFQATEGDGFNIACVRPDRDKIETCQKGAPDSDFASSAILSERPNGKRILLAGQKSGVMHAVDADTGKVLWQTRVGLNALAGGIVWGSAADDKAVYVASLTPLTDEAGKKIGPPGLTALDIDTGKVLWRAFTPEKPTCAGQPRCTGGLAAAVTLIPGAVIAPSKDGQLRAYSTKDGAVLWDYNALRDFETVNGIKAFGGSFGSAGATVAGNSLYVGSGYRGDPKGNAVLAFELR